MAPQDPHLFASSASPDWLQADARWLEALAIVGDLSGAHRLHIARLAIQQQWICDVPNTPENLIAVGLLHLSVAWETSDVLVLAGSKAVADYLRYRRFRLTSMEAGVLYGYQPSAVVAFAGLTETEVDQMWPSCAAEYFLGGAFSLHWGAREKRSLARQWNELQNFAPVICRLAEREYQKAQAANARARREALRTGID